MNRLVVGISGASGAPVAEELLTAMRGFPDWETHLVITPGAELTAREELGQSAELLKTLADHVYDYQDLAAPISSGTFRTNGMVVVPCSMKTLAGISGGYASNLLLRAADVTLKEGRKLVLITRETPLSRIHLRNMLAASEAGAIILPPMLTYYNHPESIHHMTRHIVGKILDQFQLDYMPFLRWKETPAAEDGPNTY